ncbi:MAG: hypothetical protein DMF78_08045 [Acidobacteria bacterium]|nr:MAG: hypothetical protein DMF78_08045 [Acidobacteriota bacterium]
MPRDSEPNGDPGGGTGAAPARGSSRSTPRWVKVFAIVAVVLGLLFVIVHLAGHGLGNHGL